MKRTIFIISDGTGITAEHLANSLMTQFEGIEFDRLTMPYTDTPEKATAILEKINHCSHQHHEQPLVFMTIVNPEIRSILVKAKARIFDLFFTFLEQLEDELGIKSSYVVGRKHGVKNDQTYIHRISAVEYALAHDDGVKIREYEQADIILTGVSRCGKTPTCLFMALQYGIHAANYPFTDQDLEHFTLPPSLLPFKDKLFGLTIDAERLRQIRSERKPNSQYASLEQCRLEIAHVERLYHEYKIPFINSTRFSIEEIATRVLTSAGLRRKFS